MDVPALHGKRLLAAILFVAATLVLALQLITPTPVVVSLGQSGAETTQLGEYFTYPEVAVVAVAATLLGGSGAYLLLEDRPREVNTETRERQQTTTPVGRGTDNADAVRGDGDGIAQPQSEAWDETIERLHNNEKTVFTIVRDAGGKLPQRDIVEKTDLSKATVSRTLDTLESKDLLERKRRGMGNVVVLT